MHNLHFVVIKADSGEEACAIVDQEIQGYGDENSWYSICGAVSEDNDVYLTDEGRFTPDEETNTIAKINSTVLGWTSSIGYGQAAKDALESGKKVEELDTQELWSLGQYVEFLKNKTLVGETFDVLNNSYNEFTYDDTGVTHLDIEGEKTWVVFVDMHS